MLAYSSDRGGTLDLWLRDLATGKDSQLTNLKNAAAVSANWSHDGRLIAFLDQEGALHIVEVATGAVQKTYASLWAPGRPSFGPDARYVAMAAFKPMTARYRQGHHDSLPPERSTRKGH